MTKKKKLKPKYLDMIRKTLVTGAQVSFTLLVPALFFETIKADGMSPFIFFLMALLLFCWFLFCIEVFIGFGGNPRYTRTPEDEK